MTKQEYIEAQQEIQDRKDAEEGAAWLVALVIFPVMYYAMKWMF
jgi:hypothetical protein